MRALYMDILEKVNNLYKKDMKSAQKVVKNEDEAFEYFNNYYKRLENISPTIGMSARAEKFVDKNDEIAKFGERRKQQNIKDIKSLKRIKDLRKLNKDMNNHFYGIIDANGDYYLTTFHTSFPTEIKFNFENKGKTTAPIAPYLQKDTPLTRNVINNV